MKKTLKQFGTATLLMLSICGTKVALAGERGGNGGDIVKCVENGIASYRVLDSVVIEENSLYTLKVYKDSEKAFAQIYKKLDETYPLLARSFSEFLLNYQGKPRLNSVMPLWTKGRLDQIQDENLKSLVPSHCDADPIQTVSLFKKPTPMYYYDPSLMDLIRNQKDEFSWLMIHEWLRLFIDDSHQIRLVNGFFHSEEFLASDESAILDVFTRFGLRNSVVEKGLTLSRKYYDSRFAYTQELAKGLEKLITETDILVDINIKGVKRKERRKLMGKLQSTYSSLRYIPYGDLYPFYGLYDLDSGEPLFSKEHRLVEVYKDLVSKKIEEIEKSLCLL